MPCEGCYQCNHLPRLIYIASSTSTPILDLIIASPFLSYHSPSTKRDQHDAPIMSGRLMLDQSVQDRKRRRIETWLTSVGRPSGPINNSRSDDERIETEAEQPQRPPKRVRLIGNEGHNGSDGLIQGKAPETPPLTVIADADVDVNADANAMASQSKAPQTPPQAQVSDARKRGNDQLENAVTGTGMDIDGEVTLRASLVST